MSDRYTIRNNILNNMQNPLLKVEGSYNFDVSSAVAQEIEQGYYTLEDIRKELFPWTVTREPYLKYHLDTYGLTRLGETKATGSVEFTGKIGTIVETGTIVVSRVGVQYITTENCIISTNGKATAKVEAVLGGTSGNCAIGDITSFNIILTDVYSVTNKVPISGGAPLETVESCIERMKFKASVPSHSGNVNEYYQWVGEVAGVGRTKVVPAGEHGVLAGNVQVYISSFDGQTASQQLITDVTNYLADSRTPIGAKVTVSSFVALTTNFTFAEVRVKKGSITKDDWINEFKRLVQLGYASELLQVADTISYSRVLGQALTVEGTIDFNDFKINNTTSNIAIAYNQTPVAGTVTITSFVEVV